MSLDSASLLCIPILFFVSRYCYYTRKTLEQRAEANKVNKLFIRVLESKIVSLEKQNAEGITKEAAQLLLADSPDLFSLVKKNYSLQLSRHNKLIQDELNEIMKRDINGQSEKLKANNKDPLAGRAEFYE